MNIELNKPFENEIIESMTTLKLDFMKFVNCEQNSLVYKVIPDKGNICHTSINDVANNCFYRKLNLDTLELVFTK